MTCPCLVAMCPAALAVADYVDAQLHCTSSCCATLCYAVPRCAMPPSCVLTCFGINLRKQHRHPKLLGNDDAANVMHSWEAQGGKVYQNRHHFDTDITTYCLSYCCVSYFGAAKCSVPRIHVRGCGVQGMWTSCPPWVQAGSCQMPSSRGSLPG